MHINKVSEFDLKNYDTNKLSSLHEKIIEHCQWMKKKLKKTKEKL